MKLIGPTTTVEVDVHSIDDLLSMLRITQPVTIRPDPDGHSRDDKIMNYIEDKEGRLLFAFIW